MRPPKKYRRVVRQHLRANAVKGCRMTLTGWGNGRIGFQFRDLRTYAAEHT